MGEDTKRSTPRTRSRGTGRARGSSGHGSSAPDLVVKRPNRRSTALLAVAITVVVAACGPGSVLVTPVQPSAGNGHAFMAAVQDLPAYGYTEKELFLSGEAHTYAQRGRWATDGRWGATPSATTQPFTTRVLSRYPTDPAKFNGTVVVEWINVTALSDVDVDWPQSWSQFVRDGFAYVGVSVQSIGVEHLKAWDPGRYGSLNVSNDDISWDIFTAAGQAVRNQSDTVLGGLPVKKVLATGQSQSALMLTTYTNAFQPMTKAFDGIMIHGRGNSASGLGLLGSAPDPSGIRTDSNVPVFQLQSETDLTPGIGYQYNQPDNPRLRTWEVAGSSHLDAYMLVGSTLKQFQRDMPTSPVTNVKCEAMSFTPWLGQPTVNAMPFHYVENAAWRALNRWVTTGAPPPSAPFISITNFLVDRDADGNAMGGIRLPDLEAPLASFGPIGTGTGFDVISYFFCALFGTSTPFTKAQLAQRYPTYADYVRQYTASADRNVALGYMLPEDRDIAVAAANVSWEQVWRTSGGFPSTP